MNFIEAIKKGLEAAECYQKNKDEFISVINEVNQVVDSKTNLNGGFIRIDGNTWFFNPIITGIKNDANNFYPVTIETCFGDFECWNKQQLQENIGKILRTSNFGSYMRRHLV